MSIVYFYRLWLDDVTHVGAWFGRLEGLEASVWSWNLDIWWHVRVRSWESCRFDTVRRQRHLQLLSLHSLYSFLLTSLLISDFFGPLCIHIVGGRQTIFHSLDCLLKNSFLILFILLKLECLTLKHGQLCDRCKHLSR